MNDLESLLVPGAVINKIITNINSRQSIVLFAVDFDGYSILVGPINGRSERDWFKKCWVIEKEIIIKEFYLGV